MLAVDLAADHIFSPATSSTTYPIRPFVRHTPNIHTPQFSLSPRPSVKSRPNKKRKLAHSEGAKVAEPMDMDSVERDVDEPQLEDAIEDWEVKMGELFEWVGMVGLGAQRSVLHVVMLRHTNPSSVLSLLVAYKPTTVSIRLLPSIRHPLSSTFEKLLTSSGKASCIQYSYSTLWTMLRECLIPSPCPPVCLITMLNLHHRANS